MQNQIPPESPNPILPQNLKTPYLDGIKFLASRDDIDPDYKFYYPGTQITPILKLDFLISGIWGNRFSPEVRNYKSIARQTKDRIKLDPLEIQILITGHKIKGDVLTAKLFTNYEVYTKKQQSI
jgi:hypothetical protein